MMDISPGGHVVIFRREKKVVKKKRSGSIF